MNAPQEQPHHWYDTPAVQDAAERDDRLAQRILALRHLGEIRDPSDPVYQEMDRAAHEWVVQHGIVEPPESQA